MTFYADNVEVVSRGGERSYPVRTGPFEAELEWARRESRRIVLEGMADILESMWSNAMEQALKRLKIDASPWLDELTREVREHNNFARRMPVVEEQIKVINHRIADLENNK